MPSSPPPSQLPGNDGTGWEDLPEEIQVIILSLLSFRRDDIAACRQVSRKLCRLATDLHITYAVYGNRVAAWKKLQEVMDHPQYSKTVTELVVDGSYWHRDLEDFIMYRRTVSNAVRTFSNAFSPLAHRHKEEYSTLNNILAQLGQPPRHDEHDDEVLDAVAKDGWIEVREHQKMVQQGIEADVPFLLLSQAMRKFPKLNSIVLTDYRGLAKDGESYDTLCDRLFGIALEPECLLGTPSSSQNNTFDLIMRSIATTRPKLLHSFSIGPHPYANRMEAFSLQSHVPLAMRTNDLRQMRNAVRGHQLQLPRQPELGVIFETLKHIRLEVIFCDPQSNPDAVANSLHQALRLASNNLRVLDIAGADMIKPGQAWNHTLDEIYSARPQLNIDRVFRTIFGPLKSPQLQHLTLRGFLYSIPDLVGMLSTCTTTIRELRLFDNIAEPANQATMRHMLEFASSQLQLSGVEVRNYNDRSHEHDIVRYFTDKGHDVMSLPTLQRLRRLIENGLLDGRENHLQQVYDCTLAPVTNPWDDEWWLKPRYW